MYHLLNVLSEEEIDAFTKGDCAFLAEEIVHQRPDDFIMVILTDADSDNIENSFYHIVAEHVDTGLLLDAEGIWDYDTLEEHYTEMALGDIFAEEYSMSLYYMQGGYSRAYREDTREPAEKLLKAFDNFHHRMKA